jgi:hypothetical protein
MYEHNISDDITMDVIMIHHRIMLMNIFISFFYNDFQWNGGIEVHHPGIEC